MTHLSEIFDPRFGFVLVALGTGLALGMICAVLGVYVVLRRVVFVGAALAQLASLGVAIAFLPWVAERLAFEGRPGLFALLGALAGVAAFAQQSGNRRVPREAAIGVAYGAAGALAILALTGGQQDHSIFDDLIQGNILGITTADFWLALGVAGLAGALHLLFFKEFLLVSFDAEMAQAQGLRAGLWEWLFYLILGAVIAVGIKEVGTLLVFGYLVLPAVTGLLLMRRLAGAFAMAVATSVIATVIGVYVSAWQGSLLPMGPAIVGICAGLLAVAWLGSILARVLGRSPSAGQVAGAPGAPSEL